MADIQAQFQQYLDAFNAWFAEVQQKVSAYFSGCSQNEYYAWGAFSFGFLLFIGGIVWIII